MTGTEATTTTGTAIRARRAGGWRGAAVGMFAVAWGANQFVSLLVAYREQRGISVAVNDGLFGIYAAGLIIALLLGGPAADLWGRARIVRPAVVVSLAATAVLMAGSPVPAVLDEHVNVLGIHPLAVCTSVDDTETALGGRIPPRPVD